MAAIVVFWKAMYDFLMVFGNEPDLFCSIILILVKNLVILPTFSSSVVIEVAGDSIFV